MIVMINLGLRLTDGMADFLEQRTMITRCIACGSPVLALKDDHDNITCMTCSISH